MMINRIPPSLPHFEFKFSSFTTEISSIYKGAGFSSKHKETMVLKIQEDYTSAFKFIWALDFMII